MAKAKRGREAPPASGMESAYQLWAKGNVRGARLVAENVLGSNPSDGDRQRAEELLRATFPDRRTRLVAFGSLLLIALVLIALKLAGA